MLPFVRLSALLALALLFAPSPTLASCPDEVVYGNPAHPNVLEYSRDGQVRRLHFEDAAVREGRGTKISLYLPAVHRRPDAPAWLGARPEAEPAYGAMSMLLDLDPEGTFSSDRLNVRFRQMPTLDCFDRTLGELLDAGAQEVTVAREGDVLVLHATAQRDDATLRLTVRTAQRLTRPTVDVTVAGEDVREVEAYLDAERHVVHVVRWPNVTTVPLPADGRRVARETRRGFEVVEFVSLDDGLLILDMHRVGPTENEEAIIRAPAALGLDLASVELTDATRTERRMGPVVERRLPPLIVAPAGETEASAPIPALSWAELPESVAPPAVRAPVAHRLIGTDGDGAFQLALADTLVGGTPHLRFRVEPFDLGAALLDARTEAEQDALGAILAVIRGIEAGELAPEEAADAFRPPLETLGLWEDVQSLLADAPANPSAEALSLVEAAVAPEATEADVEAALALLTELRLAPEPGDLGPPDEGGTERERLARWLRSTALRELRYQVEYARPPLFEAVQMVTTQYFSAPAINTYLVRLAETAPSIQGIPMRRPSAMHGPHVLLDAGTLHPVARSQSAHSLSYEMDYAAGHLTARNEQQGEETQPLSLPQGTLDATTFLSTIPFLDLTAPLELYLVDFDTTQRSGYSSDRGSYQTVHLEPALARVRLEPQHAANDAPDGVPALHVRVFPEGSTSFLGLRARTLPTDAEGRPFAELTVRAEAPHYPLALTVGDQVIRFWGLGEGEALPPEGLAWIEAILDPRGGP